MNIQINPLERDNHFDVNGKVVYQDSEQNWVADVPLETEEKHFLRQYLKMLKNVELPSPPKVIYNY